MLTTVLAVAAATWGVVMALAPLLQVRKMLQRRSSADVSVGYVGILLPGFVLWIGYGVVSGSSAIIVPNVVAVATAVLTIAIALRLRGTTDDS
ncbi:SemiSWEET family transporter [Georgenia yuyongxinii]